MLAMFSPIAPDNRQKQKPRAAESRVADAMFEGHRKDQKPQEIPEIEVDARGQTSVPGVFAAGDCTIVPYKQIVIAMGEGAKASLSAFDHLIRSPLPVAA